MPRTRPEQTDAQDTSGTRGTPSSDSTEVGEGVLFVSQGLRCGILIVACGTGIRAKRASIHWAIAFTIGLSRRGSMLDRNGFNRLSMVRVLIWHAKGHNLEVGAVLPPRRRRSLITQSPRVGNVPSPRRCPARGISLRRIVARGRHGAVSFASRHIGQRPRLARTELSTALAVMVNFSHVQSSWPAQWQPATLPVPDQGRYPEGAACWTRKSPPWDRVLELRAAHS